MEETARLVQETRGSLTNYELRITNDELINHIGNMWFHWCPNEF